MKIAGSAHEVAEGYLAVADDTNPKFTGQQRDVDTGLDWFQVIDRMKAEGFDSA